MPNKSGYSAKGKKMVVKAVKRAVKKARAKSKPRAR